MKGFLTWHDHVFRKTHDLVELGRACVRVAPALDPVLLRVAPLTEYAWRYRYPGEPFTPSDAEVRAALALAREAVAAIVDRLPEEARP